jgi:fructokinase
MSVIGVIGEALVDVFPSDGTTLQARPGGSPANVAVALARLGIDTRFLGRTSSDRWGAMLRDHLESQGVTVAGPVGDEPTAIAFVATDVAGQASYRFLWDGTADRMQDAQELEAGLEGLDAVHVGSVACVLEPGAGAIDTVLAPVDERLVVSFDPNVRPALVADAAAARRRMLAIADHAHIVKASDEDLAFLFPGHDVERAAWELLDGTQTHLVVVTHGADGAEVLTPRFQAPVPPVTLGPVVDTVGAGDTFMAALLTALDERDLLTVRALKALDVTTAIEVGRFAAEAAAVVVTRQGADPPTRAQVPAPPPEH